jgi:hypothetical protein
MTKFTEQDLVNIFAKVSQDLGENIEKYSEDIEMGIGMAGESFGLPEGECLIECLQGFSSYDEGIKILTNISDMWKQMANSSGNDHTSVKATIAVIDRVVDHFKDNLNIRN